MPTSYKSPSTHRKLYERFPTPPIQEMLCICDYDLDNSSSAMQEILDAVIICHSEILLKAC